MRLAGQVCGDPPKPHQERYLKRKPKTTSREAPIPHQEGPQFHIKRGPKKTIKRGPQEGPINAVLTEPKVRQDKTYERKAITTIPHPKLKFPTGPLGPTAQVHNCPADQQPNRRSARAPKLPDSPAPHMPNVSRDYGIIVRGVVAEGREYRGAGGTGMGEAVEG